MPASVFFDTNVLVYLASGDATKADRAEAIVDGHTVLLLDRLNRITSR